MRAHFMQITVFKTRSCDYAGIHVTADTLMFPTKCSDLTDSSKIKT